MINFFFYQIALFLNDLGFRVQGLGLRVLYLRLRVYVDCKILKGTRIQGLGFRVQDLGLRGVEKIVKMVEKKSTVVLLSEQAHMQLGGGPGWKLNIFSLFKQLILQSSMSCLLHNAARQAAVGPVQANNKQSC